MECSVPQEGSFLKAAERPAHGVRDNRSPMQAPVRARSIGEVALQLFAPVGRNKNLLLITLMVNIPTQKGVIHA